MNSNTFIEGLYYFPDFLSNEEHDFLLQSVDNAIWQSDLKRRVQQYGYKYDYKKRGVDLSMKIDDLPIWTNIILEKLKKIPENIFSDNEITFDQLIINEYEAGQGIASHIDCEPCFEDNIISVSLGGTCLMDFSPKKQKNNMYPNDVNLEEKNINHSLLLLPKSILVMQGEARYDWLHGIKPKKNDEYLGNIFPRTRRVSLTFRKVILS